MLQSLQGLKILWFATSLRTFKYVEIQLKALNYNKLVVLMEVRLDSEEGWGSRYGLEGKVMDVFPFLVCYRVAPST